MERKTPNKLFPRDTRHYGLHILVIRSRTQQMIDSYVYYDKALFLECDDELNVVLACVAHQNLKGSISVQFECARSRRTHFQNITQFLISTTTYVCALHTNPNDKVQQNFKSRMFKHHFRFTYCWILTGRGGPKSLAISLVHAILSCATSVQVSTPRFCEGFSQTWNHRFTPSSSLVAVFIWEYHIGD
ncbi:Hypothetical predicted protein [Olea europaea subsp. europaea]|uniref:Uncharacterized protein n=1 Tax=Olea europaea subsp. europaea TaxID=158383 RepID=A0A8S0VM96_OLEEU|nr:Hypothetical predicted protein [Olea europaea subsp. europaea]